MAKGLYYGDNLEVLRRDIADASIDLVYLDPPFNSAATYNVLFRAPDGSSSESQLEAFDDTWHWGDASERAYSDVLTNVDHPNAATLLRGIVSALGRNDMTAYLSMMAVRLIELHRVLKPTGSLYLHCDPTASHYLKSVLDGIFGVENFKNEIVWKRTTAHNDARRQLASVTDSILFYGKSLASVFNKTYVAHSIKYLDEKYKYVDADGKRYRLSDLRSPSPRPNLIYEYKNHKPHPNGWAVSREKMAEMDAAGLLDFPRKIGGRIQYRKFLSENGTPINSCWDDISPINAMAQERLGYPTQKPLALLERIIAASSNPGDIILDPFCGCGTAVHAAEKLGRSWLGIDVTHLAISLIERRLKDAFPAIKFAVHGTPRDIGAARDLAARNKHQFEYWAVSLVDAVPSGGSRADRTAKKGADRGIDGIRWVRTGPRGDDLDRMIVSVKAGENVSVRDVRDLAGTVQREGALGGVLITLHPATRDMLREAASHGMVSTGLGQVRKVMVKTVAELMSDVHDEAERLPPLGRQEGFRRAKRERAADTAEQAGLDL